MVVTKPDEENPYQLKDIGSWAKEILMSDRRVTWDKRDKPGYQNVWVDFRQSSILENFSRRTQVSLYFWELIC